MRFAAAWPRSVRSVRDPLRLLPQQRGQLGNAARCHAAAPCFAFHRQFSNARSTAFPGYSHHRSHAEKPGQAYGRAKDHDRMVVGRDSANAWGFGPAGAPATSTPPGRWRRRGTGEDHDPGSHIIPLWFSRVALGRSERISIFGDDYPTPRRHLHPRLHHVEDTRAVHRIAIEETNPPRRFSPATSVRVAGSAYPKLCLRRSRGLGHSDHGRRRARCVPATRRKLMADASRIMTDFRWKPAYADIRKTIVTAWNWHRTHPNGYRTR